jgi:hypothetical protein
LIFHEAFPNPEKSAFANKFLRAEDVLIRQTVLDVGNVHMEIDFSMETGKMKLYYFDSKTYLEIKLNRKEWEVFASIRLFMYHGNKIFNLNLLFEKLRGVRK